MPVASPAQMVFEPLRQPEIMVPSRQPPFAPNQIPPSMHFNHLDPTSFDFYPLNLYKEICSTFDHGPPLKDATALACWLGITVNENRAFEKKENQTDLIIQSWKVRRGNTVDKFVQILDTNGMTQLVDKIGACRV
ncbi:---NA--- [Paramuricea clavata]|uniref:---NA n=1 Tax=Paramuricea clavata TaxID=317549 RepID=A0A7D9K9D7_PARCT|nr:---NA--- [Paramuricea clavata]